MQHDDYLQWGPFTWNNDVQIINFKLFTGCSESFFFVDRSKLFFYIGKFSNPFLYRLERYTAYTIAYALIVSREISTSDPNFCFRQDQR